MYQLKYKEIEGGLIFIKRFRSLKRCYLFASSKKVNSIIEFIQFEDKTKNFKIMINK